MTDDVLAADDRVEASYVTIGEAAADLYLALRSEHGHDERHEAVWPACLPVHMAMNRYRAALRVPEHPEPAPPSDFGEQIVLRGGLPRELRHLDEL